MDENMGILKEIHSSALSEAEVRLTMVESLERLLAAARAGELRVIFGAFGSRTGFSTMYLGMVSNQQGVEMLGQLIIDSIRDGHVTLEQLYAELARRAAS